MVLRQGPISFLCMYVSIHVHLRVCVCERACMILPDLLPPHALFALPPSKTPLTLSGPQESLKYSLVSFLGTPVPNNGLGELVLPLPRKQCIRRMVPDRLPLLHDYTFWLCTVRVPGALAGAVAAVTGSRARFCSQGVGSVVGKNHRHAILQAACAVCTERQNKATQGCMCHGPPTRQNREALRKRRQPAWWFQVWALHARGAI